MDAVERGAGGPEDALGEAVGDEDALGALGAEPAGPGLDVDVVGVGGLEVYLCLPKTPSALIRKGLRRFRTRGRWKDKIAAPSI